MSSKTRIVACMILMLVTLFYLTYQITDIKPKHVIPTDKSKDQSNLHFKESNPQPLDPHEMFIESIIIDKSSTTPPRYEQADCVKEFHEQHTHQFAELTKGLSQQTREKLILFTGIDDGSIYLAHDKGDEFQDYLNQIAIKQFEFLSKQYAKEKDNLIALELLDLCLSRMKGTCSEQQLSQFANDFQDNAYTLFYLAEYYNETDPDKLEQTVVRILQANELNLYRKEFITRNYDFYISIGLTPLQSIMSALGNDAARWSPIAFIYDYCSESDFNHKCQDLVEFIEKKSGNQMLRSFSHRMQQKHWELNGRNDLANKISEQIKSEWNELSSYYRIGFAYDDELADIVLRSLDYDSELEFSKFIFTETHSLIQRKSDICVDNPISKGNSD